MRIRWFSHRPFLPSAIFLLLGLPFFLILSDRFSHYAVSELKHFASTTTAQSVRSFDFVVEKLKSLTFSVYHDPEIQTWMYSRSNDPFVFATASSSLTRFLSAEPYIYTVYVVNPYLKAVFDYRTRLYRAPTFPDQSALDLAESQPSGVPAFFDHQVGGKSYLLISQPSGSLGSEDRGRILFLIDKSLIIANLLQEPGTDGVEAFLRDRDGRVLVGKASSQASSVLENSPVDRLGVFEVQAEGQTWLVSTVSTGDQGWVLQRMWRLDMIRSKADVFRYGMAAAVLVLVLLLFLVLLWDRRRVLMPFRKLALELHSALGNSTPQGDDLRVLQEGFTQLRERTRNTETEQFLEEWVTTGVYPANLSVPPTLGELTRGVPFELVLMRIESYHTFQVSLPRGQRRLVKRLIGDLCRQAIGDSRWMACLDALGDHLLVLIQSSQDRKATELCLARARELISQQVGLVVVMSLMGDLNFGSDLKKCQEHLYELSLLKFYFGRDGLYQDSDLDEFVSLLVQESDSTLVDDLVQTVRAGKKEALVGLVTRLLRATRGRNFTDSRVRLTFAIFSVLKPFSRLSTVEDAGGLKSRIEQFESITALGEWLVGELELISDKLSGARNATKREETVEEILEFVESRLGDFTLNLEQIADHVSLSSRYIRQLFKDSQGSNLTDYILLRRIGLVQELLVNTALSVQQVQERSGFQSKSHFFTAFKTATGKTPEQFRADSRT